MQKVVSWSPIRTDAGRVMPDAAWCSGCAVDPATWHWLRRQQPGLVARKYQTGYKIIGFRQESEYKQMENSVRQAVADLNAEMADRQSKATAAQRSKTELTQRISQLIAAQQLDGVDHTARIATAQAELATATAYLDSWPDVQSELQRRICAAEQQLAQQKRAADTARYQVVSVQEAQLRRDFAGCVLALTEVAARLRPVIDERQVLHTSLHAAGASLPSRPSNWLPEFQPGWVHGGQVSEVKRVLADFL